MKLVYLLVSLIAGTVTSNTVSLTVQCPACSGLITGGWYSTGDVYVPSDAGAINVITQGGAVGDGVTDDTAAIVAGMNMAMNLGRNGILYFPKGHTYLISSAIKWVVGSQSGQNYPSYLTWQGGNQESTIIKLANNLGGVWATPGTSCDNSATQTSPLCMTQTMVYMGSQSMFSDGSGNEGYNMYLNDLTLDTGTGNNGAEAVHWIGSNSSSLNNITINGAGGCFMGIDMRTPYVGPMLIKNVKVTGCEYAMSMDQGFSSVTVEHATIANQTLYGIWVRGNIFSVRDLVSTNTNNNVPVFQAVQTLGSNQGVNNAWPAISIYGGNFSGGSGGAAINNFSGSGVNGQLALYNVGCSGFSALVNLNGSSASGCTSSTASYFSSGPVPGPTGTPVVPTEPPEFSDSTVGDFTNVKTYGAVGDDTHDDAPAIQMAINAGFKVVYFPFGTYKLGSQVTVQGAVCMLQSFGASIDSATAGAYSAFRINNTTCPGSTVTLRGFTNVGSFASPFVAGANSGSTVLRDWRLLDYATAAGFVGGGNIYMEDVSFGNFVINKQNLVAHQLNPEGGPKLVCNGCTAWVLGIKTENPGGGPTPSAIVVNSNQGSVFVLGGYIGTQQETGNITGDPAMVNTASNLEMYVVSDFHTWDPALRTTNCSGTVTDTPSSSFPLRANVPSPTWWHLASYNNCSTPPPLTPGNYLITDSGNFSADAGFGPGQMKEYTSQGTGYANQTWVFATLSPGFTIYNTSIGVCAVNQSNVPTLITESSGSCTNVWKANPVVGGYTLQDNGGLYLNSPAVINGLLTLSSTPQTWTIQ